MASFSRRKVGFKELISTLAIAVYEYLITFDRELEGFWKGAYNTATVLWFLVCYRPFSERLFSERLSYMCYPCEEPLYCSCIFHSTDISAPGATSPSS